MAALIQNYENLQTSFSSDFPGQQSSALQEIEKNYRNVLAKLQKHPGMEGYASEFTKLFIQLYKAEGNTQQLLEKHKQLLEQISQYDIRLDVQQKIIKLHREAIGHLKQEIEKKMKDAPLLHRDPLVDQDVIKGVCQEVSELNTKLKHRASLTMDSSSGLLRSGQENIDKNNLLKEREHLLQLIVNLQEQLRIYSCIPDKKEAAEYKVNSLLEAIKAQSSKAEVENEVKLKLEAELRDVLNDLELKRTLLADSKEQLQIFLNKTDSLDHILNEFKVRNENQQKTIGTMRNKILTFENEFNNFSEAFKGVQNTIRETSEMNFYNLFTC